jgi:hypothetical protein
MTRPIEALMQTKKRRATVLIVIALILFVFQAGFWVKSTAHVRSQTDEANRIIQHSPTEIPGVAAFCLLVIAGVLVSTPPPFGE